MLPLKKLFIQLDGLLDNMVSYLGQLGFWQDGKGSGLDLSKWGGRVNRIISK